MSELDNPKAAAMTEPLPKIRPSAPVVGARVHFSNPEDAIEVSVDGFQIKIPKSFIVLQAYEVVDIGIPRFCYHNRFSIAENCRMYLVKVEKSPKPVASCAMPTLPDEDEHADCQEGEGMGDEVLADEPLSRFLDLTAKRGVRSAGPVDGVRVGPWSLSSAQGIECYGHLCNDILCIHVHYRTAMSPRIPVVGLLKLQRKPTAAVKSGSVGLEIQRLGAGIGLNHGGQASGLDFLLSHARRY